MHISLRVAINPTWQKEVHVKERGKIYHCIILRNVAPAKEQGRRFQVHKFSSEHGMQFGSDVR
jgi:hypothetical protein